MRIFHNVTEADRRLWKAPLVSQLFPFLWAEPHHADVSLFCEDRSWQNDFSNSRSRITAWVARFLLKRLWRTVPVAHYLTNVSVCFIQLSKNYRLSSLLKSIFKFDFNRMASEVAGKGDVPDFTCMYYITTISKFISISSNAI